MSRVLREIADAFVAGEISAGQFADRYMEIYKTRQPIHGFNAPEIADSLFIHADRYCPPEFRSAFDPDYDWDDEQLLQVVRIFLAAPSSYEAYNEMYRAGLIKEAIPPEAFGLKE